MQRLTVDGKRRDLGLGGYPYVGLADALAWGVARKHQEFNVAEGIGAALPAARKALDRRLDQIRRADVIAIVAPVMAMKRATGSRLHGWIRAVSRRERFSRSPVRVG